MVYTTSVSPEELDDILIQTNAEINRYSKKHAPFKVVQEYEPMEGIPGGEIIRFCLAVLCAPYMDDKGAVRFSQELDYALNIVGDLNKENITVVYPPSAFGGPKKGKR